ncbi:MFS transporter [Microbacterium murale]|uniref:MFS transporter n=1 Tax=Microbacterium murale TaxID=1081040 RepID=A0ABQ1S4R4_9MICO|nr:MFS transporter [Microbacterium murale]GGD90444.1 MFS transporter [Microbacterium murale]
MTAPRPLWQGRALAVLGILLCAFSLRSAVASLSPLFDHVAADFPVSSAVVGLIGTAPPVCFAIFGLLTPLLERRLGLERVTVIALIAIAAGLVLRGFSVDAITLLLSTALIFAGVGMGNILLPPLVKKHFPDRLGVMMTLYTTAMALSTFVPPLVAVPVADATGWRFSLAMWGVFALAGSIPWILMLLRGRTEGAPVPAAREERPARETSTSDADAPEPATLVTGPIAVAPANSRVFARLVRLPLAWAIAVVFGTSSTMAYVSFAWLPTILIDRTGVSASVAGLLLSLFAFMGLPASLVVPVLVVRFQATRPLFLVAVVCGVLGLAGLIMLPSAALVGLWVALFGIVGVLFPLALVLISVRARTPETAVALSSFVQSAGYIGAAAFPLLLGIMHDQTGDWLVPLLIIGAVLVVVIPFGLIAGRRQTIEDAWERRHGRW